MACSLWQVTLKSMIGGKTIKGELPTDNRDKLTYYTNIMCMIRCDGWATQVGWGSVVSIKWSLFCWHGNLLISPRLHWTFLHRLLTVGRTRWHVKLFNFQMLCCNKSEAFYERMIRSSLDTVNFAFEYLHGSLQCSFATGFLINHGYDPSSHINN